MKTWQAIGAALAVFVTFTVSSFLSTSAEEGKNVEQMITEAKTPADHEAIAAYYEKEAQAARGQQASHQRMAESYEKIPVLEKKSGLVSHCNTIAQKYGDIAKDYEDLATLHKEMARSAP
jgi:uncharacterized membrane-anchored protein YhcB (DUF1043 family)